MLKVDEIKLETIPLSPATLHGSLPHEVCLEAPASCRQMYEKVNWSKNRHEKRNIFSPYNCTLGAIKSWEENYPRLKSLIKPNYN